MALKKEGKTYCDKCGKELDHIIVCTKCGVMYPDYCLVQASKPPRRQVEKPDLFTVGFTLRPAAKQTYVYTGAKKSVPGSPKTFFVRVGLLAMVALLAAGTGYFFHLKKVEQMYQKNFMRALYTMKVGTDLSLNTCSKLSSEWKTNVDAGQKYTPHISADDESHLSNVKDATDRFMQTLIEPPKKFINSKEKLDNLYKVFTKANSLAVAPSGTLSSFTESSSKTQSDFNVAIQELKGSLTPELSSELKIAKTKYKGLKEI
jgi:hypothetical protein